MVSTNAMIILDSKSTPWSPGPGWVEYPEGQFLGGSCAWARFNDSTASLNLTFTGMGISYVGNSPEYTPWNFTATIDGGPSDYHGLIQEPEFDQLTFDWYVSPPLEEGQHTLVLSAITPNIAIDYTVVTPSATQYIRGQMLIVDDQDPLIKYTGSWQEVEGRYLRLQRRAVKPFGGGTHVSTTPGDILQIPFTGSIVQVYGLYDWTIHGQIILSFAIDNKPTTQITYPRPIDVQNALMVQPNFLFYEAAVTEGDHVLTINVTDIMGEQKVIIDAIHYKASFDTLLTLPEVGIPAIPQPSHSINKGKVPRNTEAIIGTTIGGFVALALIVSLAVCMRRRAHLSNNHATTSGLADIEPFILGEVPSTTLVTRERDGTHLEWVQAGVGKPSAPHSKRTSPTVDMPAVPSTPTAGHRNDRVVELERQIQSLARRTEELMQTTHNPPPYSPQSAPELR